ncbi:MAG: carboxypeptidase-like regulatory domain-containing protein, partial [Saprospiraceae bacterium]
MLKKGIISAFILFVTLGAIAQNGIIKGTVKDKLTNEPIIGANILIVGTSSGTATDFDGNF